MTKQKDRSRNAMTALEWSLFQKVWNESKTICEVSEKLGKSANSVRCRASVMRKKGFKLKPLAKGDARPPNSVWNPTPEEIKEKCKQFLANYTEAELERKFRCDMRRRPVQFPKGHSVKGSLTFD